MRKRIFLRGDKKFWAPIAIGSGLTIFFFGATTVPNDPARGLFTLGCGLLSVILGLAIAPIKEPTPNPATEQLGEQAKSSNDTQPSYNEAEYKTYLEERRHLQDALLDQSRSFDKYVLTMAASTFGLSFLFIQHIVPEPTADTMRFLVAAWGAFAGSILITLISFLLSQKACLRQIEILGRWLGRRSEELQKPINVYTRITQWFNWLSMAAFISGVALLITFGAKNMLP
ncbi:MAG: hypothetical protein WB564_06715 [Dehalococcoidia bacterium]